MNNFEIVILALALVFDSWEKYVNAGLALAGESITRKYYYSGITFIIQLIMTGTGIWVGSRAGSFDMRTNILISLSIMLVIGLRILLTVFRQQLRKDENDYTEDKRTFFAALSEGVTPLFIGISVGFLSIHLVLHWILISFFLFTGIVTGLVVAKLKGTQALRYKFGMAAGFLFIAAAIKLALNISMF